MSVAATSAPAGRQARSLKARVTQPSAAPAAPATRVLTEQERAAAKRSLHQRVLEARRSGAAFNEYVLRHEYTNKPIRNGRHHEEWQVQIDRHKTLVLWAHIESAKTSSITVGRVLYELGRNPNLRVAVVSETYSKAQKVLQVIKRHIESNERLHEVFPKLRRSKNKGDKWNDRQITVERPNVAKDPSVIVTGAGGSIQGARVDLIVLDDILSFKNTRTTEQREKLLAWFKADIAGRLTDVGRVIAVGTAWTPDDLYHHLAQLDGWVSLRYGVLDDAGKPLWPEVWPLERIAAAAKRLGHVEANRQLYVKAVADTEKRCKDEYVERSYKEGFGLYAARTLEELLGGEPMPEGAYVTTGIDVASSVRKKGTGLTVAATALHYPDGLHQIICIEAGRMTGPEILALARSHHQRFNSLVFVENNGAQAFLLQFAEQGEYFPVMPHHTGANKWDPTFGVESLFVEMANGKWAFPNDEDSHGTRTVDPEVAALVADMKSYSPNSHTPDRIMSLWIGREGARKMAPGVGVKVGVRELTKIDEIQHEFEEEDEISEWGE